MKNINLKKKATTLSLAMSMALALPIVASAQEGMFQRGVTDEEYYGAGCAKNKKGLLFGNRNVGTNGIINNQTFGQPVPVGSGMLILLAAGAGYAIYKRKEDEK